MKTRLFHLMDDAHPAAMAMLPSLVAAWPEADHRVGVLGNSEIGNELQIYGGEVGVGFVVENRLTFTGLWRARELAAGRVVVAWSARCARAAAVMLGKSPCAWVVMARPDRLTMYLMRQCRGVAVCVNPIFRSCLEDAGLRVEVVRPLFDSRLLSPIEKRASTVREGVGGRSFTVASRRAGILRACDENENENENGNGNGNGNENEKVIGLLSDDPRGADVMGAVLAINLAATAMADDAGAVRLRLRVHPEGLNQVRGRQYVDTAGRSDQLLLDPEMDRAWRRLGACDAAMLWGSDSTIAWTWARSAGLAIVDGSDSDPAHAADQLRWLCGLAPPRARSQGEPGQEGRGMVCGLTPPRADFQVGVSPDLSDWRGAFDGVRVRT